MTQAYRLEHRSDHICGHFSAMASPCEILIDQLDPDLANHILSASYQECQRIEQKYSRYLPNNLMYAINNSNGNAVAIDEETFRLLSFADTCYQLSDGLFDISSGVLRRAWKFDGSDNIPTPSQVNALLPYIGWPKITFDQQHICLPPGFELDFGGIGKEYAVDCVAKLCHQLCPQHSVLVNFGGDIQVTQPRQHQGYWQIGIEDPNNEQAATRILRIASGGLATSGDARRYLLKDNKRYSHILNPKTGYPIEHAPRSVTIAAEHCIQSGLLATLALLQGANAETFLEEQGVKYWCFR